MAPMAASSLTLQSAGAGCRGDVSAATHGAATARTRRPGRDSDVTVSRGGRAPEDAGDLTAAAGLRLACVRSGQRGQQPRDAENAAAAHLLGLAVGRLRQRRGALGAGTVDGRLV
jgi:hypothetical protein